MGIGQRIKQRRIAADMTLEEVARIVGVSRQTMSRYETGIIGNIPSDKVVLIAAALRTTPAFLMGWENGGIRTRSVPRVGRIACGEPILAEQNIEGYDNVPDFVRCDYTVVCKGDSMIGARINDGDIVCVKAAETADSGQICVVSVEGAGDEWEATLKRVRFTDNGVALWPENPNYAPLVFTGDDVNRVHVQGIATHFISVVR